MSRIDYEDIWLHHLGNVQSANCPCCNQVVIHRGSKNTGRRDWDRGHIIPDRLYGPDILENVRPICTTCNKNDKTYASNYHYMALALGRMTLQEANASTREIWDMFDRQRNNLSMVQCLGLVHATGEACTKSRKANSYFCAVHGKKPAQHFQYQTQQHREVLLQQLWQDYYDAGIERDAEKADIVADMIYELIGDENDEP